ncbi:hypothetical protein ACJIZ3_012033 [Penstemon smallii]|uniref:Peptidase metallopeptidase domain-containing protein n=1 Tax=Penstemon smallii TaxID=265156 RepID=A0ABD3UME6_9LAMI
MAPKPLFNLITCILFLLILNPCLLFSNAQSNVDHYRSPLAFLKTLIGTREGHMAKNLSQLKKYLSLLGYMKMSNNSTKQAHLDNDLFDKNLEFALKKFQVFYKLKVNGILDEETVQNLIQPRCGVSDFVNLTESEFNKSSIPIIVNKYTFFPGQPKWPRINKVLTYSFPPGTRDDVMEPIRNATQQWASVAPFKFTYIKDYDKANIKISFQRLDHGDGSPFDGPGGILAHAFLPTDGRLHYDGDEKWANGPVPGNFDLQTIGLHELGHVLGLGHSNDGGAVMFPTIGSGVRKDLGKDDIDGMKALYQN